MAMDFPVDPIDRLPIFSEEAASAAALMDLIRGEAAEEEESANGSRWGVADKEENRLGGFGTSLSGQIGSTAPVREEPSVAAGGGGMSDFSESEGDNADVIDHGDGGGHLGPDQNVVIEDRVDSGDGASAQSTGKMDPQAPGWTKRKVMTGPVTY